MSYGESRKDAAARILKGLRLDVDQSDPPEVADRKAREAAQRMAEHDALFAPGFMLINNRLVSRELGRQLGFDPEADIGRRRAMYDVGFASEE